MNFRRKITRHFRLSDRAAPRYKGAPALSNAVSLAHGLRAYQSFKGSLVLSLNEETLNLTENSGIVLVCDGVLHGGMPVDCVYECLDFDLNEFLRGCSAGKRILTMCRVTA